MKEKNLIIIILLISSIILNIRLMPKYYADRKFKDMERKIEYSEKLNKYCKDVAYMRYERYKTSVEYDKTKN
jgi:hypothetical protein